jgi:hypothetical protein
MKRTQKIGLGSTAAVALILGLSACNFWGDPEEQKPTRVEFSVTDGTSKDNKIVSTNNDLGTFSLDEVGVTVHSTKKDYTCPTKGRLVPVHLNQKVKEGLKRGNIKLHLDDFNLEVQKQRSNYCSVMNDEGFDGEVYLDSNLYPGTYHLFLDSKDTGATLTVKEK